MTAPGNGGEWQDIATAPRDGTVIDVWVPSDDGGYRVADLRFSPAGRLLNGCNEAYLLRWPTHWMPLPNPPERVTPPACSTSIRGGQHDAPGVLGGE